MSENEERQKLIEARNSYLKNIKNNSSNNNNNNNTVSVKVEPNIYESNIKTPLIEPNNNPYNYNNGYKPNYLNNNSSNKSSNIDTTSCLFLLCTMFVIGGIIALIVIYK